MTDKEFDLFLVANPIVDILINVEEAKLAELGLVKGSYNPLELKDLENLTNEFKNYEQEIVSGGSNANAAFAAANLGTKIFFTGAVGKDGLGAHYTKELEKFGISHNMVKLDDTTGTCISLITPDSQRTMCTYLGASNLLSLDNFEQEPIKKSTWALHEGYLLANDYTNEYLLKVHDVAKDSGTKIAFALSAEFIVDNYREQVEDLIKGTDLLFASEEEALALAKTDDVKLALETISKDCKHIVITTGEKGSLVFYNDEIVEVPAFNSNPVDTTGAGDIFCGIYIHSYLNKNDIRSSSKYANYCASKIVEQIGARYSGDVKDLWEQSQNA